MRRRPFLYEAGNVPCRNLPATALHMTVVKRVGELPVDSHNNRVTCTAMSLDDEDIAISQWCHIYMNSILEWLSGRSARNVHELG